MRILEAGGGIKSVQRGVLDGRSDIWTEYNTSARAYIPINKVDTEKSIVVIPGIKAGYDYTSMANDKGSYVLRENDLSVWVENLSTTNSRWLFHWQIVEFKGNIRVQRGRSTITGLDRTIAINPVNREKAFINISNSSQEYTTRMAVAEFVDDETIRISRAGDTNRTYFGWEVIEHA